MSVRYYLRANALKDKALNLSELKIDKLLLLRSSNVEQTVDTITCLRKIMPGCKIHLLTQQEFLGRFEVDEEICCPHQGGFLLNSDTTSFYREHAKRKYPLVLVMYNNLIRKGYLEVERCAVAINAELTAGIFADNQVVGIDEKNQRRRQVAAKLENRLMERLESACDRT